MNPRLNQQIAFLVEADKLKSVVRRTPLVDDSRLENSAEHSWHLVLLLMVLREYGPAGIDWMRVMEMVAVHDLVEIDAGDVFAYDVKGLERSCSASRRRRIASSGSCPAISANDSGRCGTSSKRSETPEARFANAVDRLQPLLQNEHCGGGSWCGQTLADTQILRRMAPIQSAMPDVWPHVLEVIESFCRAGVIQRTRG